MTSRRDYSALAVKILTFAMLPALSAFVPLVAIPVITGNFGGDVWVAIALGISIGSAAAVLIEIGWGLNGSIRVARANRASRKGIFGLALYTKIAVLLISLVPVVGLCFAVGLDYVELTITTALAYSLTGLTCSWYFIGIGSPLKILLCEVGPRILFVLVSCLAIIAFQAPVVTYCIALVLSSCVSVIASCVVERISFFDIFGHSRLRLFVAFRQQRQALFARAASALYIALPVTLVGFFAPVSLLVFSSAERMLRMLLSLLQSVPNSFQSYVGEAGNIVVLRRRVKGAVAINVVFGVVASLGFGLMAQFGANVLFSGLVVLPPLVVIFSMIVIFATCCSRAVGSLGLVAFRDLKSISASAAIGALVGIIGIIGSSIEWGAQGALGAMAAAELIVLIYQAFRLFRFF
ncbi:hypothetical protein [Rhodococcoides fascians]|uniref:Polysaccharide biosynthesis protein C-terminal domain-containing protein n=1 Tax=Rhodococcoides fascians TaxID=1828 RepID=A0A143QK57_RHOFA|nr:hypothetical protein [Rhodococcus fascians]AMY23430.1 hypothetical protein A3Q41_02128 [Rhodococcus fascians]